MIKREAGATPQSHVLFLAHVVFCGRVEAKAIPVTETTSAHHTIQRDGAFEIELEGNPSTGYDWDTAATDAASLARVRITDMGVAPRRAAPSPDATRLVGAPVVRRWRVTALAAGTAQLIFRYRRAWESAAPVKTHSVIVEISN